MRVFLSPRLRVFLSPCPNVEFARSPDLICGIELQLAGKEIAWSVDNYLESLGDRLSQTFEG